jgi:RNA 2',3'-cyclic 3'-phosphodiesterase
MIRAFIALPLPDDIKDTLQTAIKELKEKTRGVRWVRREALHITLKFLGDIPEDLLEPLSRELNEATRAFAPLNVSFTEFGVFPNMRKPRVVWAGLSGDVKELSGLASSVEKACARCGIPEEKRPFSAHITLGRLKIPTMLDLGSGSLAGKFTVSEVLLFRSELLPGGPRYTVLHKSSLESKGG